MSIAEMQMENFNLSHVDRFDRIRELEEKDRKAWFEKEKEYWLEVLTLSKHTTGDGYSRSTISRYLQILDSLIDDSSDFSELIKFQNTNALPLHDEHPHNEHIKESAKIGLLSLSIQIFNSLLTQQNAIYTSKYKSELLAIEEKVNNKINLEIDKYNSLLSDSEQTFNKFVEKIKTDLIEKLQKRLDNATTEIQKTVTTATDAVLSAEPVKYWDEREKKHKLKARSYRYGVTGAALLFLATLVFLTISVYKNGETYTFFDIPMTLPAEKFSIALLIIATTATIWLIRILVKLMMTNLALEIEALERSTMIKTYIAIDSTKEQSPEVRMLFFTTLFRPSNNSLTDDSTSPEYIRIIEAMLQKKT